MSDAPVLTRPKPKRRRFRINAEKRRRIEAAIEAMINALDAIEDPDSEGDEADDGPIDDDELDGPDHPDDEPSLGATEHINHNIAWRAETFYYDGEPSLGSIECIDQRKWASGGTDEREDEHDGREPDEDNEPSLGSCDRDIDQTGWVHGDDQDLEDDRADNEPSLGTPEHLDQARAWGQLRGCSNDRELELGTPDLTVDQTFDPRTLGSHDEREAENEHHDGDTPWHRADDEPSLGSLNHRAGQTNWAAGSSDDREDEHDGREPDVEGQVDDGPIDDNELESPKVDVC